MKTWRDNKFFITLQYSLGIQNLTNLEYHLSVSCPFHFQHKGFAAVCRVLCFYTALTKTNGLSPCTSAKLVHTFQMFPYLQPEIILRDSFFVSIFRITILPKSFYVFIAYSLLVAMSIFADYNYSIIYSIRHSLRMEYANHFLSGIME